MADLTEPAGAYRRAEPAAESVDEALASSMAEADRILSEAGWTTTLRPPWRGRHCAPGIVGGVAPGGDAYVKVFTSFPQAQAEEMGYDPADYPDTYHEAAAWLVEHVRKLTGPPPVVVLETPNEAPVPESPSEGHADEAPHDPVGGGDGDAEAGAAEGLGDAAAGTAIQRGSVHDEPGLEGEGAGDDDYAFDAEFEEAGEAAEVEGDSLGAELLEDFSEEPEPPLEPPAGEFAPADQARFYGLDDLDRRRSLRIGDVMRYARTLMPFWTTDHDTALVELRNFTMGVSEGRWPDDTGRRAELDDLERTLARIGAITKARDEKVEFLEGASREEIEAFDPEANWP